jgi:hypothetical protein
MAKIDMKTRRKVIDGQKARYKKATKKEKGQILDSVCMATGLSRDRVKKLLANPCATSMPGKMRSGRNRKYGQDVRLALEWLWPLMDYAGGRRLCAGMDDMLDALIRFGEFPFEENIACLLREMSPSTADRLLKRAKDSIKLKGRSTTKPGTLLKKDIPIRLGTQWDENIPGFIEVDLVAHCGWTTAGEYVNTLDATDIYTGWTETRAVINKAQKHVFEALKSIRANLPFDLLGIDSDSGSEFINNELYRYCKEEGILFTRSRPYMKNDSCHVEQKNWHVIRRNIGYGRYEGADAVRVMNEYYALLRLHTNFFMPHTKLISKSRDGARVRKQYETPKTPYKRLLEDEDIPQETKDRLMETYLSINPAELKRGMDKLLGTLAKMALPG